MPSSKPVTEQFDPLLWGGRAEDLTVDDGYMRAVYGTSGEDRDVRRYQDMAGGGPAQGPLIDQTRSNEAREYGKEAMGLLVDAAGGKHPSQAMLLGRQQMANAQAAQQSMANTVRGGAAARAAASRSAAFNAATIGQTGRLQEQATRANEMANARGMLFGAATTQRGQDMAVATDQAKLDAAQRAANAQRETYYERMGWDTRNAALGQRLGRTAAEQSAANAGRAQSLAEEQGSWGRLRDTAGTIAGGAQGAVTAYEKTNRSPSQPSTERLYGGREDPYAGSDERMKQEVVPLYEPPGKQLHQGFDGRAFFADEPISASSGKASLTGPEPLFGRRSLATTSAPPPERPRPKPAAAKAKKKSAEELAREADELMAQMRVDHEARMSAGPAVARAPEEAPVLGRQLLASRDVLLSDERAKTSADDSMANANRAMAPYSYEYRPEFTPPTQKAGERNVGPMAQNMAKDPVASSAVVQGDDGLLMIDKEKGLKLVMGGLASVQQQIDQLKRRKAS